VKRYVRCKACGYIMEEGKLADRCPACGAPKSAFMPYTDPLSTRRRNLLKLDLHPVAVHFPVSLTAAILVFVIAVAFLSDTARSMLVDTTKILLLLVPVLVIAAGVIGFIDGRVRFRKIKNSMILKRKIVYASLLFVVLTAQTVIVWIFGFTGIITAVSIVLGAVAIGLIVLLSRLGVSIMDSAFPG
jgi:rubredoxin/uncharacterized membrane protein